MFSNRYSKLLTVVLISVIIAVIGLLIFFGIDVYRKYYTQKESEEVLNKYEEQLNSIITNSEAIDDDINDISNNILNDIEPDLDFNTSYQNTTTGGNSSNTNNNSSTGVTYKGYDVIGMIEIPKTKVKYPIIESNDVSIKSLKVAICNLYGTLNKKGDNAVLVGHNYRNGTFFSNNKKLEKGDKIYITDNSGNKVTYIVYKKYETGTGDFGYATREIEEGKREISLSTCTDDTKKRLIIWAAEE